MKVLKKALVALFGAVLGCCFFVGCLSTKLSVTYVVDGETYRVQEYEMDTQISLPTPPTKAGYTFIGWYTDEALTIPYAEGKITAGVTLYAKFSEATVYIVVNVDGGTKIDPIEVAPGAAYTVPEAVKEGYTFVNYTYINDQGEEVEFPLSGVFSGNASIRITAKYTINKYTVKFVGETESEEEVAHGSVVIAPAMEKAGYELEGWYVSATEQTDATKFDLTKGITADVMLYAKYSPKTFTITVNGAQAGYANPQVVYGETYTLATPDRGANYEFIGFTKDGVAFPATGTYTWTENIAVKAEWDGIGKDIAFYDGANELVDLRIESEYDTDVTTLTLPGVPAKAGYSTDNVWYTDSACTQAFVAEGKLTADVNLYAKYTANQYTVTFSVWNAATKTMENVPVTVTYNEVIANVPAVATRDAYNFLGYKSNGQAFDATAKYTIAGDSLVEETWELKADASLFEYISSTDSFRERETYDDEWTFIFLINVTSSEAYTYTFAEGIELTMVTEGGEQYATVAGNTLTTKKAGTFVVQVNNNGEIYQRTFKTLDEVASLTFAGTNYDNAWGLNEQGTDYKRNATDVWQRKTAIDAGEMMQVGRTNFIPEININGGVTTIDKANVVVEVTVAGEVTKDYTIANGAINFGESLAGKVVTVVIEPKYAVDSDHKAVYDIQLNEGVNVYTNEEMKAAFANASVAEINVLRNIKAVLSSNQEIHFTVDGWPVVAPYGYNYELSNGSGVYERVSGDLRVNGNYFNVDAKAIPLVDGRAEGHGFLEEKMAMQDVHFSIFLFGHRDSQYSGTFTMENLNIIGNGDMNATELTDYKSNEGKDVLKWSGAAIGIQVGGGTLNVTNVTSRFGSFALNAYTRTLGVDANGSATFGAVVNATDCKFEKSWANNIYTSGFVSLNMNGCFVGAANGAAIHMDIASSPENVDNALNLVNTDIQNWVLGTEAWFNAYNVSGEVGKIKAQVDTAVRLATGGAPVLNEVGEVIGATGGAKTVVSNQRVNFAILIKGMGDNSEWITDNKGIPTVDLTTGTPIFDAIKFSQNPTDQENGYAAMMGKYAKFGAQLLGTYMEGYVEIVNA